MEANKITQQEFTEVQKRELDLSISNGNHTLVLALLNVISGMGASYMQPEEGSMTFFTISILALGGLLHRGFDVGAEHIVKDVNNAISHLLSNN